MALLQDYTSLKGGDTDEDLAWLLHLDRLILSAEAELRWLERAEARLDEMPDSGNRQQHSTGTDSAEPVEVSP